MTIQEATGWILAAIGVICAIAAAYLKAGAPEALAAAGVGFTGLSATWGMLNKTPTK